MISLQKRISRFGLGTGLLLASLAVLLAIVVPSANAAGTLAIDAAVNTHQSSSNTTIKSPAFSTTHTSEVVLAFIGSDGPTGGNSQSISSVTGGGLTWTLRQRSNSQSGTSEIWQAIAPAKLTNVTVTATRAHGKYQGSISIVSFTGADTSTNGAVSSTSAASGAPTISLTTTRNDSWVWATGDDWDGATARTLGSGQTMADQYVATNTGDTYWTQRRTTTTPASGTVVTLNDTAPTNHRWNLAAIEILAANSDVTPPTAPSNLAATATSSTQVNLSWTASTDATGVTGYNVYRSTSATFVPAPANLVASLGVVTSYSNSPLALGTYYYYVIAKDAAGNASPASNQATATLVDTTAPSTPANLTATAASPTQVNLGWSASTDDTGVAGYKVLRDGVQITSTTSPSFVDTTVAANTSYSYTVQAYDAANNTSGVSGPATVTTPDVPAPDTTAPSAPANLAAAAVSATQINLTWSASSDNIGVTGYQVYRNGAVVGTTSATSYGDTGLTASTAYSYYVIAQDAAGNASAASVTADATTLAVTAADPVGQAAGQWTMKFSDEFDGDSVTTVDATNGLVKFDSGAGPTWQAWYPSALVGDGNAHSNNPGTELEYYDIPGISVGNGILTLTATKDNAHSDIGLPYTSGLIQSNPTFNAKYGYAETRMKAPALDGSWPAFWMIASSYIWPPEFDIFENFSDPGYYRVSDYDNNNSVIGRQVNTDVTAYHVYGLKWEPNALQWYLDGNLVASENNLNTIPAENMYLVLNMAVRNANSQSMSTQVDYVRFWQ